MSEKNVVKPVALAVGAALVGSFAISGTANADTVENPFSMSTLSAGYMLGTGEGSCGEGSCGEKEGDKKSPALFHSHVVKAIRVYTACMAMFSVRSCVYNRDLNTPLKVRQRKILC